MRASKNTNYYAALKFSERLSFETSIRQWQIATNPNISRGEIETILTEIRNELSTCSSLDEVLDTMRALKEEAKIAEQKQPMKDNDFEPDLFTRVSSTPEVKRSPSFRSTTVQKLGSSFKASILPGCALLLSPNNSAKSLSNFISSEKYDLLDSPLLANVGRGESSPGRSEIRDQLISIAKTSYFAAGDRVVEAGSIGDSMFFVAKGSLLVMVNGVRKSAISEGECFGEVALVSSCISIPHFLAPPPP